MNRILSTVLFAMIVFSGCSYKEFEDGIKTKVSGGGNSEDGSAILMTEETPDMQENKIYGMGEEIPAEDGISYIVESTRFIHNINDAGLKQEDMNVLYSTTLDEDGNIILMTGRIFVEPKNYLWPVPFIQTQRNPNLLPNNPGWE